MRQMRRSPLSRWSRWSRWPRWLAIFGCWTLLGLFSGSRIHMLYASMGNSFAWKDSLSLGLVDWYSWALLAPTVVWVARRFSFEPGDRMRAVLIHLPVAVAITVTKMAIEFGANQAIAYSPQRRLNITYFHPNFLTYLAILGVVIAFDYHKKYRENQMRASRLEAELSQAQLQLLRMQLQPHFLFNTLHAISTLMRRDVAAADRMIARLSDLLRLTLDSGSRQEVPLKAEMDLIRLYLDILQIRFQDRLTVEIQLQPEALDMQVPSMILQPIVENAIQHGIASRTEGGRIGISATLVDGRLRMQVRDDGPGLPPDGLPAGDGIGLTNTRSRLEAIYGAGHRFEMSNGQSGGLTVTLEIPARCDKEAGGEDSRADRG